MPRPFLSGWFAICSKIALAKIEHLFYYDYTSFGIKINGLYEKTVKKISVILGNNRYML